MYPLLEKSSHGALQPGRRNALAAPDGGARPNESLTVSRPAVLEGAELWAIARSSRAWAAYHTTYVMCVPRRLEGRQQWRCAGNSYELGVTSTLLLEPGALAVAINEAPGDLDFLLVPRSLVTRALAGSTRALATPAQMAADPALAEPRSDREIVLASTLIEDTGLVATFDHLRRSLESAAPEPLEQKARLDAYLRALVERAVPMARATVGATRCGRALDQVRQIITERYAARISLDDLALETGFSKFYLERSFNDRFGVPIHQYLKRVRIGMALALLREGSRPSAVARAVGFADQPHMTRVFRDELGITPRTYWAASRGADQRSPGKSPVLPPSTP